MIVGNGLISTAFRSFDFESDPNVIIYASGVSNSQESRNEAFLRERTMLLEALALEKFICYFSTCSIDDPQLLKTPYVVHKREMEALVATANDYLIVRLPQVVGRTANANTLTNYIYNKIISAECFYVYENARRNLIDVDDVALIVNFFLRNASVNRTTINVASPVSISIGKLVSVFESILGKNARYDIVNGGGAYTIDIELTEAAASQIGVKFDDTYIERVIRKYYGR